MADAPKRLDITHHSLYTWIKMFGPDSREHTELSEIQAEIRRLQNELKRATEARDKGAGRLSGILDVEAGKAMSFRRTACNASSIPSNQTELGSLILLISALMKDGCIWL